MGFRPCFASGIGQRWAESGSISTTIGQCLTKLCPDSDSMGAESGRNRVELGQARSSFDQVCPGRARPNLGMNPTGIGSISTKFGPNSAGLDHIWPILVRIRWTTCGSEPTRSGPMFADLGSTGLRPCVGPTPTQFDPISTKFGPPGSGTTMNSGHLWSKSAHLVGSKSVASVSYSLFACTTLVLYWYGALLCWCKKGAVWVLLVLYWHSSGIVLALFWCCIGTAYIGIVWALCGHCAGIVLAMVWQQHALHWFCIGVRTG